MRIMEVVDIRYSAFEKPGKMHVIGGVYDKKKNLKVPHAKYVDTTNRQKKLLKK